MEGVGRVGVGAEEIVPKFSAKFLTRKLPLKMFLRSVVAARNWLSQASWSGNQLVLVSCDQPTITILYIL